MRDTEGRGHRQEVLELVLRTFLYLQLESKRDYMVIRRRTTDPQSTGSVRLHDLPHVPHKLGERVPDLAMLDHERLGDAFCGPRSRGCAAFEMSAVLATTTHNNDKLERAV